MLILKWVLYLNRVDGLIILLFIMKMAIVIKAVSLMG
jgi:hypothetical protein